MRAAHLGSLVVVVSVLAMFGAFGCKSEKSEKSKSEKSEKSEKSPRAEAKNPDEQALALFENYIRTTYPGNEFTQVIPPGPCRSDWSEAQCRASPEKEVRILHSCRWLRFDLRHPTLKSPPEFIAEAEVVSKASDSRTLRPTLIFDQHEGAWECSSEKSGGAQRPCTVIETLCKGRPNN